MKIKLHNDTTNDLVEEFNSPQSLMDMIETMYSIGYRGFMPVFEDQSVMFIGKDSMVKYSWTVFDDNDNELPFSIEIEEKNRSIN